MAAGNQITLPDFYTTFWHCDVKKDHSEAYVQGIAPAVLEDILPLEGNINEGLFSRTCFHNLFNHVVRLQQPIQPFTEAFHYFKNNVPITGNFEDEKPTIHVDDLNLNTLTYEYVCINRVSFTNNDVIEDLQIFLGSDIVKFTDTHAHIDDLHRTWSGIGETPPKIYQVRSREIQMDPASKIIPSSCGDPNMYYLEKKPAANSLSVEYPKYTVGDPASYFYSKYPVFLDHRGYEQNGYNLKTQFSYKKGSRKIVVSSDRNTANVKTDLYFAALAKGDTPALNSEKELIEGQILAKAHGDIGQVLAHFRDMDLVKYSGKGGGNNENYIQEVNTFTGLKVFESHDTNPITKAFTLGIDCIWMHVLGHDDNKKLIVFKKKKFETPGQQEEYDKARLASRITSLKKNIIDLSGNLLEKLNSANTNLSEFYKYIIGYSQRPTDTDYKSILKRFAWLSIISASIRDMENYVKEGQSLFDSIEPLLQADINKGGLERKLQTLSNQLYTLQDIGEIDLGEDNFNSFKMEDVGGVLIREGERTMWKNRVFETVNLFDCIDLDDGGDAISKRASETKSLQSWGISIIHDLYFGYHLDKAICDIFIRLLYNTLLDHEKKKKFTNLLLTIRIADVDTINIRQNLRYIQGRIPVAEAANAPAPQEIAGFFSRYYNNIKSFIGKLFTNFAVQPPAAVQLTATRFSGQKRGRDQSGGYSNKTLKYKMNKKRTTYKQKGGGYVKLPREFVNTLITEIRDQVDFLINITYATKLGNNMTKDILDKWWGDIGIHSGSETEGNSENNSTSNTNVIEVLNFNHTPKEKSPSYSVNEIQTMITILLSLYNSSDSDRKQEISQILFDIQYMLLSFHRDLDISGVEDISGLKLKQEEFLEDHYDIVYSKDFGEKMLEEENELFRKMPKLSEPRVGPVEPAGVGIGSLGLIAAAAEAEAAIDRNLDEALGEALPGSANGKSPNSPKTVNTLDEGISESGSGNGEASRAVPVNGEGTTTPKNQPPGTFQDRSPPSGSYAATQSFQSPQSYQSALPQGSPPQGEEASQNKKTNLAELANKLERAASPQLPQQQGPPATRRMNLQGGRRSAKKQKSKNKKKSKNSLYSKTYKRKGNI